LKNSSNGAVSAPPVRIWGVFEKGTAGTFRPFLANAPYPSWRCAYHVMRTITRIEQGTGNSPTLKTLVKLADVLEVGLDELAGRKVQK
jgi:hypothetical protein